jgi:hypothetical protein
MSKMGSQCSFEHLKHKLWPKEGVGSRIASLIPDQKKLRIDSIYLASYHWKALYKSYNFALDRTSIQGLLAKLWGSKVPGAPAGGILGLPRGTPGREKSVVASQQLVEIFSKIAQSSMWNSINSHPSHIPQKHFHMLSITLEKGSVGYLMVNSLQFFNPAFQH